MISTVACEIRGGDLRQGAGVKFRRTVDHSAVRETVDLGVACPRLIT